MASTGSAVAVLSAILLLPPIEPLTPVSMKVGGIFLFTVVLRAVFVAYPLVSLVWR